MNIFAKITYNSGDSLVVTDPTTNPPVSGLTMGERTGSRIFHYLWSYVLVIPLATVYKCSKSALAKYGEVRDLQCMLALPKRLHGRGS
jgi:hypothetical protein